MAETSDVSMDDEFAEFLRDQIVICEEHSTNAWTKAQLMTVELARKIGCSIQELNGLVDRTHMIVDRRQPSVPGLPDPNKADRTTGVKNPYEPRKGVENWGR